MESIEQKILLYDDLPASERAEVDAYLVEHPGGRALQEEGRQLRGLLDAAARTGADLPDAETVAEAVVARYMGGRPLPPALAAITERVAEAVRSQPEVERQHALMVERLKSLSAEAASPLDHFEQLTGRRLGSGPAPDAEPPAVARREREREHGWRADRAPVSLRRLSPPRLAFA
ncbi:MAG: hypothetical protein R3362_10970, partial [Rhodothermales bacterium]|nr:hypothetical protein [Rhodothermales bacterium]